MSMEKETCAASSIGVEIVDDVILEKEEDDCSICLDPFSALDPSTVSCCKHEYHLHCILEWCQRSKECPICWQVLVLKDPVSQELLVAAGSERAARLNGSIQQVMFQEAPYMAEFSPSSAVPPFTIGESSNVSIRDSLLRPSSPPIDSSRRSSSSELLAFSNSIRSKFSAASTRCKESISKGTNGFKDKIFARNTTVKELSREVQREMNAGIAGVAKLIERLDLSSKRTENKGKDVQDNRFARAPSQNIVPSTEMLNSDRSPLASKTISSQQEVSFAQVRE